MKTSSRTAILLEKANNLPDDGPLAGLSAGAKAELKEQFEAKLRPFLLQERQEERAAFHVELQALQHSAGGHGLALDDVLDFLLSKEGAGTRAKLTAFLAPDVSARGFDEPASWTKPPRDEFEAGVRLRLQGRGGLGDIEQSVVVKAVVAELGKATGHNGRIDESKLSKKTSSPLMLRISEAVGKRSLPNPVAGQKLVGLDAGTIARIGKGVFLQPLLSRMGGFDVVADTLLGDHKPLKGAKLVAIQHFLPTFGAVLRELERAGVAKDDMRLIGKSYSTVDEMYAWLVGNGYDAHPGSIGGSASSVEEHLKAAAKDTLQELFAGIDPKTSTERFVLADDGGKLLLALHQFFPQYAHLCCGFEQTARGIQVLEQMQKDGIPILCPIVNMAHSALKAKTEIPLIGANIVFDSLQYLDEIKVPRPKTATVLGYGPVGQQAARALRAEGIDVVVYDPSPARQREMVADGYAVLSQQQACAHGDLVVGCTGRGSLTLDDLVGLKDGAVLANGASGNHEFAMQAFGESGRWMREMAFEPKKLVVEHGAFSAEFQGKKIELGTGDLGSASQHRVLFDRRSNKEILVLRSGHVVNLGKDLPPEFIQTTRALVLASCLQAATLTKPGIVDVDAGTQDLIEEAVDADLKARGLSLSDPRFSELAAWSL